ncbi:MAG: rod shape-determining protein [Oscillospiraceae bacterium]|nr:rod shape-determining protein [Oscillospiraceae bacterium]
MGIFSFGNNYIGIDLGTSNILVAVKNKKIVFNEPSVVAINKESGNVIAIGKEAKEMVGKNPDEIEVIQPLKNGVIADYLATEKMIKIILKKVNRKHMIKNPKVIVGIPTGITEVEERALQKVFFNAGAKEVYLIEEPTAAAIGANLQVSEPTGSIIVDIGGGTTEVAVISLNGIVATTSIKVAGDTLDDVIVNYLKRELNIIIGKNTAERIKKEVGTVLITDEEEQSTTACGRDVATGLPKTVKITSKHIQEAIMESVLEIVESIKITLEKTPPEISADLGEKGIYLSGGGALIKNLDKLITYKTEMPVFIAENALECVVNGTMRIFDDIDSWKSVLISTKK